MIFSNQIKNKRVKKINFNQSKSSYDVGEYIEDYFNNLSENKGVAIVISINKNDNIILSNSNIYVRNFVDNKKSIKIEKRFLKYFIKNLKNNKNNFIVLKQGTNKYGSSAIDGCGFSFINMTSKMYLKDPEIFKQIKKQIFRNINKLLDFHEKLPEKFASVPYSAQMQKPLCKGCNVCDTITCYGNMLNEDSYSRVYLMRNKLLPKTKRQSVTNKILKKTHPEILQMSNKDLIDMLPYYTLFCNYGVSAYSYGIILGNKKNIRNVRQRIQKIVAEMKRRDIFKVKKYESTRLNTNFDGYSYFYINPDISYIDKKYKVSVTYPSGRERLFLTIKDAADYFGYSPQRIEYHMNKLHKPLAGKIFQSI